MPADAGIPALRTNPKTDTVIPCLSIGGCLGVRKKKLLWILPYFPYPPLSGGSVRVFNLIKHLSPLLDIDLVSFIEPGTRKNDIKEIEKFCGRVTAVERRRSEGTLPMIFQDYDTPEMRSAIIKALDRRHDFVQIDYLTMAYYARLVKESSDLPLFFTEHDVSWLDFERCFHNRHLDERLRYFQWEKNRETAAELYRLFDAVITVSRNDAGILRDLYPEKPVFPAPTGTDCSFYAYEETQVSSWILYTGHYAHYPNVDAVKYFLNEVFPLVKKERSETKFIIGGSGGRKAFPDPGREDVRVTGEVKDLRPLLYNSGVFAAPVRMGIGIRGKILEAMACGLPVVTSSTGMKGIGAEKGVHLLADDTPEGMAESILRILNGRAASREMAVRARKFVEENYDWPVRASELYEFYLNKL